MTLALVAKKSYRRKELCDTAQVLVSFTVMQRLLLIIPAYNEEKNIARVLAQLQAYPYDYVVINDGSTDGTADVCRETGATLIELPFNMGLAAAFQTGMRYAYENGYAYAMQFDADGQHLPEYIAPMLAAIERDNAEIVLGSRYLEGKHAVSTRSIGMRLIRGLLLLTTGKHITDPTSGMRLYNRSMIALYANHINFGPEPDTLAYLMRNGVRVSEVSVSMQERTEGQSYLRTWSAIRYMCKVSLSILPIQFVRPHIERRKV